MTCPSELELSRAITGGDRQADPDLAAHLAGCAACRATWDDTQALIELARELPAEPPAAARREEIRTAVLAGAANVTRRPARRAWLAPVIASVAAAGVLAYLAIPHGSPPPGRRTHGVVRSHPGARYQTTTDGRPGGAGERDDADQIVRLSDGVIDVDVEPLAPGERFRVLVGGSEIEVRGTVFTVTASAERLTGVTVARGRVDVRPETGAPAVLVAGQSWHVAQVADAAPAPVIAPAQSSDPTGEDPRPAGNAVGVPPPSPVIAPRSRTAPAPHRAALSAPLSPRSASPVAARHAVAVARPAVAEPQTIPEPSPAAIPEVAAPRPAEELAYDQAWEALRANEFSRAANGFARVLLLAPDSPLVEDAGFWRAVALARGKRTAEALSAFRDFLDAYGRSARAGEASAMLGWILIDARAYDEAERRFRVAAADANAEVCRSARAGLGALASRKP